MSVQTAEPVTPFKPRPANGGRLCQEDVTDGDCYWALGVHLAPLGAFFIPLLICAPLVVWLIRKDESVFVDDHGREVLNFLISFLVWHVVLTLSVIGILLIPVLWVVGIINVIRGAIAGSNGEYFRYPVTIRFIS